MAPKVDFLQYFIKTAAISGIGLVWVNFTIKSFKMAWHIMFTPQEEDTREATKDMCEECQEFLCETCRDYDLKE